MKTLLLGLCLASAALQASAQMADDDKQLFNHVGLGVSVGMDGIGFDVATTITPYAQARAGFSFMPKIKVKDIDVSLAGIDKSAIDEYNQAVAAGQVQGQRVDRIPDDLLIDGELKMSDFKLLFDLYPTKTSPWRLTVGFYCGKSQFVNAYTTNCQQQLSAITDYNEWAATRAQFPQVGLELGNYLIKPDGPQAQAFVKVNSFKPYIGIGSGRAISAKHRFSFAWDLGVQFWGTPKIYVQDQQIDEGGTNGDDGGVIKTISKITVYPTFSFRFNGRIL